MDEHEEVSNGTAAERVLDNGDAGMNSTIFVREGRLPRAERSMTMASLPVVMAKCDTLLYHGGPCLWIRHILCVLTATCESMLDHGVLAVGHGHILAARQVCLLQRGVGAGPWRPSRW